MPCLLYVEFWSHFQFVIQFVSTAAIFLTKSIFATCIIKKYNKTTHPDVKPFLYSVHTTAPPSPTLCCSAYFTPDTCRLSASPRSCQQSSLHWARPVAPSGWPLDIRPPLGLITYLPPYVLSPRSINSPALPVKCKPLSQLIFCI